MIKKLFLFILFFLISIWYSFADNGTKFSLEDWVREMKLTSDWKTMIYVTGDYSLYKKWISEQWSWTLIPLVWMAMSITITPDDNYIIYRSIGWLWGWWKLYKKWINDNSVSNWTVLTNSEWYNPIVTNDGNYIIYDNWNFNRTYIKDINSIWDWTELLPITKTDMAFITKDDRYLIYLSLSDNYSLYKKDLTNWTITKISTIRAIFPKLTSDNDYVIYEWTDWIIRKKLISDNTSSNGSIILSGVNPYYLAVTSDNNYVIYWDAWGSWLYKKLINPKDTTSIWERLTTILYYNMSINNNGDLFYHNNINIYTKNINTPSWDANWNSSHYILNQLDWTKWNMQVLNNVSWITSFSDINWVKNNFLINYWYMQTWYVSKWLNSPETQIDWNNWWIIPKNDIINGDALNWFMLSAHYPFLSYKKTDPDDNSIYWRTNLENTSFQSDTTWNAFTDINWNPWLPVFPIKNSNNDILAYIEYPCWNLICKDTLCSDLKKSVNQALIINEWTCNNNGVIDLKDEECDWTDWILQDKWQSCNNSCKIVWWYSYNTPVCWNNILENNEQCDWNQVAFWYSCNSSCIKNPIIFWNPPNLWNTWSIVVWTPPGNITLPSIWDININTWMTVIENNLSNDIICNATEDWLSLEKTIIVTNTMADTSFLSNLKWKDEFLKTLSGSSVNIVDKIIQKKLKTEKLNEKSSRYDLWKWGEISWIQFNLTNISNSVVMKKLVNLAIDHSSSTMTEYKKIIQDTCNWTNISTWNIIVPTWFIDINEKWQTMLNLFRYNWE